MCRRIAQRRGGLVVHRAGPFLNGSEELLREKRGISAGEGREGGGRGGGGGGGRRARFGLRMRGRGRNRSGCGLCRTVVAKVIVVTVVGARTGC